MMLSRRYFLAAATTIPFSIPAIADIRFPSRPIRLVVPYSAGGGTDIIARLVATHMSQTLSNALIVENRAGAAGIIGSEFVANAAADGYTILLATVSTNVLDPALYKNLPYDPIQSFAPISLLATVAGVVVVNAHSPITSLQELADAMRKAPEKYSFGSQGVGGIGHLMGEMFNRQAETQSVHIPYKGVAPALQDLIAGNIQIVYDTLPALLPQIQSGVLRALAVTGPHRQPSLPQVPTSAEAGFPDFQASTWNALLAPANTQPNIVNILNQAAVQAVRDPEVQARMRNLSADPVGSTPSALREFMKTELKRWGPIVKASGVHVE